MDVLKYGLKIHGTVEGLSLIIFFQIGSGQIFLLRETGTSELKDIPRGSSFLRRKYMTTIHSKEWLTTSTLGGIFTSLKNNMQLKCYTLSLSFVWSLVVLVVAHIFVLSIPLIRFWFIFHPYWEMQHSPLDIRADHQI